MGTNGNIEIFRLIDALSICAGVMPHDRADTLLRTEIIDFGTYALEFNNPEQPEQMTGLHHDSWGHEIKLQDDLLFGFRVHFSGVPPESEGMIEIHFIRPAVDQTQGETDIEVKISPLSNGKIELVLYQITSLEEMIPGIWTFEVHYRGRIIALKNFNLVE